MTQQANEATGAATTKKIGALATVTVVGGTILVNGSPVQAAPFEVINTDASGVGSLAQAIADANANGAEADTITFSPGLSGTIELTATSGIQYDLSIVGPGDGSITITTTGSDALYLYNGASLTLSGLTFDLATNDAIQVNAAGDVDLSDIDVNRSLISGNGAGAVTMATISASRENYASVVDLANIDSVALEDVEGESPGLYYSSVNMRFDEIGSGDAATADVVLAEVGGAIDGVNVQLEDVAGDVEVTGAALGGVVRVRRAGDVTVSAISGIAEVYGAFRAYEIDRGMVSDVNMSDARGGNFRFRQVGPSDGDVSIERATASDVVDARVSFSDVRGRSVISDVSNDSPYSGLYVSEARGDVTISDVDLRSGSGGLSIDARTPSIALGDPLPTLPEATIANVEVGSEGSIARIRVSDFNEVRIDGENTNLESAPGVDISESTVWGSFSVNDSNVTMSDVSIVGRGDGVGGDFRGRRLLADTEEGDLLGDGAIPIRVSDGALNATQVSVLRHKAEHALYLDNADVAFAHSTIGQIDVSVATVGVSNRPSDEEEDDSSTLDLDHTVLADAGPDGAFVAESEQSGKLIFALAALTSSDQLSVTADYSLVGDGVIESEGLADTNVEAADPRIGDVVEIPDRRPTAAPLADSPAVNAGDPAIADAPALDQRGNERIREVIDIGAVEVGSLLQSISPARFVDTRDNGETVDDQFEAEGKRTAGSTYTVQIGGRGDVPLDATSVIMNVTSIQPDSNGFVTVFSCDDDQPTASSLNFTVGSNLGNEIVAGLAADGSVCLFTSAGTHLTVDVVAFATADSAIQAVTPARAYETRLGEPTADGRYGGAGQVQAGAQRTIAMGGRFGIPLDAAAVIINVTAINPEANGFATVHPCLATLPTASSLNYTAGVNRGNEIIAPLSDAGELCVFSSAATDLAIDVVGFMPDGAINSVTPSRLLETRQGESTVDGQSQGSGPVAAGSTTTVPIAGRAGVPNGARAVVVNLTAINPSSRGFATMHPCLSEAPDAASLNYEAGVTGGNEVIAGLNDDGELCVFSSASTNMAIDIVGYII